MATAHGSNPIGGPVTGNEQVRAHRLRVMSGRDPNERHRAATPLELLYDLTFVVAFGVAGEQFAHLLAEGHFAAGLAAFGLAIFAICWAWINFSWFASACDTDDWAFRLATMVRGCLHPRQACRRRWTLSDVLRSKCPPRHDGTIASEPAPGLWGSLAGATT